MLKSSFGLGFGFVIKFFFSSFSISVFLGSILTSDVLRIGLASLGLGLIFGLISLDFNVSVLVLGIIFSFC